MSVDSSSVCWARGQGGGSPLGRTHRAGPSAEHFSPWVPSPWCCKPLPQARKPELRVQVPVATQQARSELWPTPTETQIPGWPWIFLPVSLLSYPPWVESYPAISVSVSTFSMILSVPALHHWLISREIYLPFPWTAQLPGK